MYSAASNVLFKGIDIVKCDYGNLNAIVIGEHSSLTYAKSEIKGNTGSHALIKIISESELVLEDMVFEDNITKDTLPIIIDEHGEGDLKMTKCRFINHQHISDSVKRDKE